MDIVAPITRLSHHDRDRLSRHFLQQSTQPQQRFARLTQRCFLSPLFSGDDRNSCTRRCNLCVGGVNFCRKGSPLREQTIRRPFGTHSLLSQDLAAPLCIRCPRLCTAQSINITGLSGQSRRKPKNSNQDQPDFASSFHGATLRDDRGDWQVSMSHGTVVLQASPAPAYAAKLLCQRQ